MTPKVPPHQYKSLPDSEQITNRVKISRLLEKFTKHYTPLTISIPGHKEYYTSYIVAIKGQYILFDELLPSTGHQILLTERRMNITGKLDGIDIQFFATLNHVTDKDKVLTYYMNLPGLLEYRQRRQDFRVHIPMSRMLPVFIENQDEEAISGELRDLSNGGAGIIFLQHKTALQTGIQHECAIELPDGEWIYCTAELRYAKDIPTRDARFIGVQFMKLSPVQERLLGHSINELEREYLRNHPTH